MKHGAFVILEKLGDLFRIAADGINNASFQPTEGLLHLAHYTIFAMLFLFFVYGGLLFGHLVFSLLFNFSDHMKASRLHGKTNREILSSIVFKFWPGVFLGVVPLASLGLCYAVVFHGATGIVSLYYFIAAATMLGTVVFARIYQFTLPLREDLPLIHFGAGILAFLHLGGVVHIFASASHMALNPEYWIWIYGNLHRSFMTWNLVWFANILVVGGLALSAAFLHFRRFGWADRIEENDTEFDLWFRRFTNISGVVFVLHLPVFIFLYLSTLQYYTMNPAMFSTAVAVVGLLFLVSRLKISALYAARPSGGGAAFFFFLGAIFLFTVTDQIGRANASGDVTHLLELQARGRHDESMARRKEAVAGAVKPDGEEVFKRVCASCHAFDRKVVGPSYDDVLPKYAGNLAALKDFIREPVKVDPAFPPMPKPAVSEKEIEAVAEYLLAAKEGGASVPVSQ